VLTEAGEYMRPRIAAVVSSLGALRWYVTSNFEYIDAHRRKIMAFMEIMNGLPQGGTERCWPYSCSCPACSTADGA
jgi:hypothetical protein